jgi:VIT1/CCC1 family predicted Fe2+/Mn2+ transporter
LVSLDVPQVVAGAAGGNLGSEIILIMGFSNLLADGLSMGLGDFISSKAEDDFVAAEHARETW